MSGRPRFFPFDALVRLVDEPELLPSRNHGGAQYRGLWSHVAERLGITPKTVTRIRLHHGGRLTPLQADRFAVRLGYHPAEIWPDWWLVSTHSDHTPAAPVCDGCAHIPAHAQSEGGACRRLTTGAWRLGTIREHEERADAPSKRMAP